MSLTGFNRLRRLQQVESMKPENIIKEQEEAKKAQEIAVEEVKQPEPVVEEQPEIKNEEKSSTSARRRRKN